MCIDFLPSYIKLKKMTPVPSCENCRFGKQYQNSTLFVECTKAPLEYYEDDCEILELKSHKCKQYEPADGGPEKDFTIEKAVERFKAVTGIDPLDEKTPGIAGEEYRPYLVAYLKDYGFSAGLIAKALNTTLQNVNIMYNKFMSDYDIQVMHISKPSKCRASQ